MSTTAAPLEILFLQIRHKLVTFYYVLSQEKTVGGVRCVQLEAGLCVLHDSPPRTTHVLQKVGAYKTADDLALFPKRKRRGGSVSVRILLCRGGIRNIMSSVDLLGWAKVAGVDGSDGRLDGVYN